MIVDIFLGYVSMFVGEPIAYIISLLLAFIAALILTGFIPIFVGWVARKISARIQSRYGPVYVGPFGLLQNVADAIKLLGKSFLTTDVDWLVFNFVPIAMTTASFLMISIIPLGLPGFSFISVPFDAIFIYVLVAVTPLFVLLAGWGSNNKYSMIGWIRGAAHIATYELTFLLSIISISMLAGGYNFSTIVTGQSKLWYIAYFPLTFLAFVVASQATIEREPFDLPEASQELQAGWEIEYGGIKYGLFFVSDYVRLTVISMLIVYFFLGGWLGPSILPAIVWFWLKTAVVLFLLMVPRWVLGRPRIDQLLRFGWNWLLPLAVFNLLIVGALIFV